MSENKENVFKFIWKIENFSYCWNKMRDFLKSPDFEMYTLYGSSWCLKLYPRGISWYENYVCVRLERLESCIRPVWMDVDYEIAFLRTDGSAEYVTNSKHGFNKGELSQIEKLACRKDLLESKKASLLPEDILTVQCLIFTRNARLKYNTEIIAKTHLEVESFDLIWECENCFVDPYVDFYALQLLNGRKHISFELGRSSVHQTEYISLNFTTPSIIKAFRLRVCILDSNKSSLRCLLDRQFFQTRKKNICLITVDEIRKKKFYYLQNDKLVLKCDLTFCSGVQQNQIEIVSYDNALRFIADSETPPSKEAMASKSEPCCCADEDAAFKNDFRNLLQEGTHSDLTLIAGNENMRVHKAILGARSPVLTRDMKKNGKNILTVPDLDAGTVRHMLTYMYTDSIQDLDCEMARNLCTAAYRYGLMELARTCSDFLKQNLCVENVAEILVLANLHTIESLKKCALNFICDNETEVMCSKEWKAFMKVEIELAAEVMHSVLLRRSGIPL